MKALKLSAVAMGAVLFAILLETSGYGAAAKTPRRGRGEEVVTFAVVQIGDEEIRAVSSYEAREMPSIIAMDDKRRQKEYDDAKKAAKSKKKSAGKGSTPGSQPDAASLVKPKKRKVTILKDNIRSMQEAEMLKEQYIREGRLDKNVKSKRPPT